MEYEFTEDMLEAGEISIEKVFELREIFDKKIGELMRKYGYADIYEGKYEPVTERLRGTVRLYYPDGRVDVWIYFVDIYKNDVLIFRDRGFEGDI